MTVAARIVSCASNRCTRLRSKPSRDSHGAVPPAHPKSRGQLTRLVACGYKVAFPRQNLRWGDRYGHSELRRRFSLKDSARGWHIGVIASDGRTDMTLGGEQVVGR